MQYSADICSGGTASADSILNSSYTGANAFDNNTSTQWVTSDVPRPHWLKYDLGAGVVKIVQKLRLWNPADGGHSTCRAFKLQGSNNDSDWVDVYSGECADAVDQWQDFTFINTVAYRYYRVYITTSYVAGNYGRMGEVEMLTFGAGVKSMLGLNLVSAKTVNGLAIASVKTINGLA